MAGFHEGAADDAMLEVQRYAERDLAEALGNLEVNPVAPVVAAGNHVRAAAAPIGDPPVVNPNDVFCVICQDHASPKKLVSLACGHSFHFKCLGSYYNDRVSVRQAIICPFKCGQIVSSPPHEEQITSVNVNAIPGAITISGQNDVHGLDELIPVMTNSHKWTIANVVLRGVSSRNIVGIAQRNRKVPTECVNCYTDISGFMQPCEWGQWNTQSGEFRFLHDDDDQFCGSCLFAADPNDEKLYCFDHFNMRRTCCICKKIQYKYINYLKKCKMGDCNGYIHNTDYCGKHEEYCPECKDVIERLYKPFFGEARSKEFNRFLWDIYVQYSCDECWDYINIDTQECCEECGWEFGNLVRRSCFKCEKVFFEELSIFVHHEMHCDDCYAKYILKTNDP